MIVTNKKFAQAKGYALGAIIDQFIYDEWAAQLRAEHDTDYERVMSEGNTGKGCLYVAYRNCSVGSRAFMRGETFYVTKVKSSAFGHWRLQGTPSRSSVFATLTMPEIESFANYVPKHKEA